MIRRGDTFTGYASDDGVTWTKVGSKTIEMAQDIYVGFAVDANKAANSLENLSTAKFSNIAIHEEFTDVDITLNTLQQAVRIMRQSVQILQRSLRQTADIIFGCN